MVWTIALGVGLGILAAGVVVLIFVWLFGTAEGRRFLAYLVLACVVGCFAVVAYFAREEDREEAAAAAALPNPPDLRAYNTAGKTYRAYKRDLAAWDSANGYVRVAAVDECRLLRENKLPPRRQGYRLSDGSTIDAVLGPLPKGTAGMMQSLDGDAPLAVYEGDANNTTASTRADIRLTVCDWAGPTSGYFRVFPPLGGGGTFYLQTNRDSVRIATTSENGDLILWFAARRGDAIEGDYTVVGGPFLGQRGTWRVSRFSGAPMPDSLHLWH